ncbi:Saccharopine dehydrogenase-domain-containing protein [Xylogone sp. PMI_703]|nr:Saccharopine dehydrogenase-domain-containing protein [Xylogone sp. PMI_703]
MSSTRQYDLVLFGATGYTGKFTATNIATHLPTDLRWALAGRSESKLKEVAATCRSLNPDRLEPGIEICNLDDKDLDALAKKTKVLISTVGPYLQYGEHAFKACAENGTHYIDCTGEAPFVVRMIKKYENTAKKTGAILIPQMGLESVPADILTLSLVNKVRERFSAPTKEVVISAHEFRAAASGGTIATVLKTFDVISVKEMQEENKPFSICPIPPPQSQSSIPWETKWLGVRAVSDLGILTDAFNSAPNVQAVYRSWGLLGGANNYGPRFRFSEHSRARNYLTAVLFHFALTFMSLSLVIPFVRKLAIKYLYKPGDGPTPEQSKNDGLDFRGVGIPDVDPPTSSKAFTRVVWNGSMYDLTGAFMSTAAISLLRDEHKDLTGGVYTPATLGEKFIDRLGELGFKIETKVYE